MSRYALIASRGWLQVALVASNTYLIAHGHLVAAAVGGFAISAFWWTNARSSGRNDDLPYAWAAYGAGAAVGTISGVWLAAWVFA